MGYLLDLAPKDLERIIYFAAYVVTRIDEERRHKDFPGISTEIEAEKRDVEADRDEDVKKRLGELEDRLKELEGEGAKGAQLTAAKREAQRDVEKIHEAAGRETQHLDDVLAAFKSLKHRSSSWPTTTSTGASASASATTSTAAWAPRRSSAC